MKWRCDHHSCNCDLRNRKLSQKNVFGASTGFEPVASALALHCSTNCAMKTLLKSWLSQASIHNCLNCVHNCDDHSWLEDPYVGSSPIYWVHSTLERNETYQYYVNCGHTNANAEATGSNPIEAPKTFFRLNLRLLKSQLQLQWSHLHFICMSAAHIIMKG